MALNTRQLAMARYLMGLGARRGLGPGRQRELAATSYAESGLNPAAVNPSSGAAGLFQLLSPGYRSRAAQLGGVLNPRANALAIINDYTRYWQQHPRAAPGEAGRDVERSGMGAGFYAKPLAQIPGGAGPQPPEGVGPLPYRPGTDAGLQQLPARPAERFSLIPLVARSLMQGRKIDFGQIAQALRQQAIQRPAQQPIRRQQSLASGPKGAGVPARAIPVEGGWADPARGKVIGTPFAGTHTLGNWESDRALDVSLPFGSPVYSPFAGTVGSQFGSLGAAPSSRFGGLRLHVAAPTGQEWYGAHLSRFAPGIRPGRRVRPGQVIGYSGSAAGVPHLHEALRYGDPYRLIR
jgi:murein DD-endopeptidase MepM/ murein hydrolase activator NlpD